jgi:hypothetical protein
VKSKKSLQSVVVVRPWLHAPDIDAYVDINLDQIIENLD